MPGQGTAQQAGERPTRAHAVEVGCEYRRNAEGERRPADALEDGSRTRLEKPKLEKEQMKKTAVAVAVAASALGMSQFAVADFVKDSKLSLDLRNYYYAQDTDGGAEGGQWGQAFMLNYKSGYTEGAVGFGVDLFGAAAYRLADHGDYIANNMLFGGADQD